MRPFQGAEDNVCCYICNKNLDGWEAHDEAWEEHVKHAPNCPIIRLDIEGNRLITFSFDWPFGRHSSLSAENMSKAGFFYWPKLAKTKNTVDDTCLCFQCGLALDGWEETDDPSLEHSKRRPDCPYVKSRIALRPCSYEFILASKPDQTAVKHISAKFTNNDDNKKFQLPTGGGGLRKNTKVKRPTLSRKDTIITEATVIQDEQNIVISDLDLIKQVEGLFTVDDLDKPIDILMKNLIQRKIESFDQRAEILINQMNTSK